MKTSAETSDTLYRKLLEAAPDLYLILTPGFVIVDASDAYLEATMTQRADVMGRHLFDVFPDNPSDLDADGVSNLTTSLNTILLTKEPHTMLVQKYDIRRPDGTFEERFWSPKNTPVLDENRDVIYIIHRVEDVTEHEQFRKSVAIHLERKKELEEREQKFIEDLRTANDRFLKLFSYSPSAIVIADNADNKIMYLNKAFEQMFSVTRQDSVDRSMTELGILPENELQNIREEAKKTGRFTIEMEFDGVTSSGVKKRILSSNTFIKLDNRVCFMMVMLDISVRKKIENELRDTNHFLDTILENIPNMVFVKDAASLRFLRFNKAGEDMLGYSRKDLLGKNDHDFFSKEQADFFTEKDRQVFVTGQLLDIEEEAIQTKAGNKWLHTKKIPVFENNKPLYLVGISEDITERKKHLDAILQLNKELESFSYSVSHDLRAPLRAVTGFAQMLQEDYGTVLDAGGKRLLDTISRNAEKMGRLIDDLLAFSRLGRKELVVKETNMTELTENVMAEISKVAGYHTSVTINKLHPANVDRSLMTQVMFNLLNNAVKYSSKKERPQVYVNSEASGGEVIYSVKDNGAGFDMRYANKLFGVFQRLHTTEEFEGTGVGLAIVQRIVTKHGGRVWAEGKVDEGATIYFSLPQT